ncbi:IS3 family transposase [Streptomyces sp. NPDC004976]
MPLRRIEAAGMPQPRCFGAALMIAPFMVVTRPRRTLPRMRSIPPATHRRSLGGVGAEEELAHRIREIHTDSRGAFGALQIAGITRWKSRSMTRQDRSAVPAPDLVLLDFTAPMPGLKLVGDITCMPTAGGRLYPATVVDLCTREVVGWSMADHMRTQLVDDAIRMAHAGGHTAGNAIFHSYRGSRYNSRQFWATQAELDIRQSFGRTGLRFANAAAGSFFAILKAEIGTTVWETRTQARQDVFRWIAGHYNRERLHSTIGYITPYEARTRYRQRLDLAALNGSASI